MDETGVCVIGSGPTGVIAASTLVNAGVPVVMLESGGTYPHRLHIRFRDHDVLRPAPPVYREAVPDVDFISTDGARWISDHRIGGLSNFWAGIALRFSKGDFSDGGRMDAKYRWPICYEDLEPYYARVEKLIRVRGAARDFETLPACRVACERGVGEEWSRFAEVCAEAGRALTFLSDVHGPSSVFSRNGTPQNLALRVLDRLRQSSGFRLVSNARATRILTDGDKPHAKAVEFIDTATGTYHKIGAKAVVVAAGPLASAQILLNSKSALCPEGLGNTEGVLGRYLHDHPLEYTQIEGDFRFRRLDDRRRGGLYVTRRRYADSPPLQATAFLLYGGTFLSMSPYLLLLRHRYYLNILKRAMTARHNSAADSISLLHSSLLYVCCFGTQLPVWGNAVRLHPEKRDRYGIPLLEIHARYGDGDLENMNRGRAVIPELLEAAGSRVTRVTSEMQSRGTSVHYGGAVRMHDSPRFGMLDKWNRLHAVKNVMVADASCFTTCVEKNPTLTAMAISMRAAENLAADSGLR